MLRIIFIRFAQAVPALLGITLLAILLVPAGDAAVLLGGQRVSQETVEAMKAERGIDLPWHARYTHQLKLLASGRLKSDYSGEPVFPVLFNKFKMTVVLAFSAMLVATLLGLIAGCIAAWNRGKLLDRALMSLAISGISTPVFVFAFLLIAVFVMNMRLLPLAYTKSDAGLLPYLMLHALTLGVRSGSYLSRMVRSTILEVLGEDYILFARAKGLSALPVFMKHALRNAMLPIVTIIGLDLGSYLAGSIITEVIFSWPGIGKEIYDAIGLRDTPMIFGGVLFVAVVFLIVNMLVDISYRWLDPRLRKEEHA